MIRSYQSQRRELATRLADVLSGSGLAFHSLVLRKAKRIQREISWLDLSVLIGVTDGVTISDALKSHKYSAFRDDKGTLVSLTNDFAWVEFGDRGSMRMEFWLLRPATELRPPTQHECNNESNS